MTGFLKSFFGGTTEEKKIDNDPKKEAFAKLIGAIKKGGNCAEEIDAYKQVGGRLDDIINKPFSANFYHLARAVNKQAYDKMTENMPASPISGELDASKVLYYAALYDNKSAVKNVLDGEEFQVEKGSATNRFALTGLKRFTPLVYALYRGNVDVAREIADNTESPLFSYMTSKEGNYPDDRFISVRNVAVQSDKPNQVIDFLEEKGFDLGGQDQGGTSKTLLEYAIEANKPEIVDYLMTKDQVLDNQYTGVILEMDMSVYEKPMKEALERAREAFNSKDVSLKKLADSKINSQVEDVGEVRDVEGGKTAEEDSAIKFNGEVMNELAQAEAAKRKGVYYKLLKIKEGENAADVADKLRLEKIANLKNKTFDPTGGRKAKESIEERIERERQEKIADLNELKQIDFRDKLKKIGINKSSSDEQEGGPSITSGSASPGVENKGRF